MHTLHLLRHAKSSWKEDVEDHERGLTRRGCDAARRVGEQLPAAIGPLDLVLVSSAVRTRQTWDLVLAGLAPPPHSLVEDELYLANAERLLQRLRRLPEDARDVLVIGHNPGLHELALRLADPAAPAALRLVAGKFPTASRVSFQIPGPWRTLGEAPIAPVAYVPANSLPGGKD